MFAMIFRWRWWIWGIYAAAWSTALLVPVPEHPWVIGEFHFTRRMLFAKAVHLSAYAVFAILTGWLRAPVRFRFLLMFLLMLHATLTEVLQFALDEYMHRHGDLLDVALDNVGIALGMAVAWKWWTVGGTSQRGNS